MSYQIEYMGSTDKQNSEKMLWKSVHAKGMGNHMWQISKNKELKSWVSKH